MPSVENIHKKYFLCGLESGIAAILGLSVLKRFCSYVGRQACEEDYIKK